MDREPIAIIGVGCRFPKAKDKEAFWKLLQDGVDAVTEVPAERWDVESFYDSQAATPDQMNARWGGFLADLDQFDPEFFKISPREAISMDPQQRLLLEVAWEALEDAGQTPERLTGTRTGVFMGINGFDYYARLIENPVNLDAYAGSGNTNCMAANRISYFLNFTGPSLGIDTACSSSLVAVHLACQSIWNEESTLALAGGVRIILSPWITQSFAKAGFLAADGRCKTFDSRADGYVRSEGAGVVVLKPLSQALTDRDPIYAVIRGSAVNQDGHSNGLTAPNPRAQEAVLRLAYRQAGVSPSQVQYVEAHGTGTKLGDPIEMKALGKILTENRPAGHYCAVGSVKTNIGHLEAAAGIAGLIKVALSLKYRQIPPSLHFQQPNPYIPFDKLLLRVQKTLEPWPQTEDKAIAGVSSFSFGGTNAHVVLEEAPVQFKIQNTLPEGQNPSKFNSVDLLERPVHLLTLSAKTEKALEDLVLSYQNYLETHREIAIADVCFSANTGRSHFNHRLAIITADKQELAAKLAKISAGEEPSGVFSGKLALNSKSPKIAFLFTGQGSQYVTMGRQLYETQPVFRRTLDQCEQILQSYLEKSLLDVIYPENSKELNSSVIDQTAYTQPALFAIEYSLFQLWQSWGIKPDVVMGHSVGEYVAATVAGVFSLEDGLKLIAHRGRFMQELANGGEMVAVMASLEKVNQLIAPYTEKIAIAAINGPESVVISGEAEAIGTLRDSLELQGIKTKKLQVSHAFHSPLMEPILAEFEAIANQITYHLPGIKLLANVTGNRADNNIATANYWVNHVRQPVKFAQSLETLHQEGYEVFLEIGTKPILLGMGRQCLPEGVGVWLPSLRSGQEDWQQMLHSLGELYVQGVKVDWLGFDRDYSRSKVVLPTYPFQRQHYWIETSENKSQKADHPSKESQTTTIIDWLNNGNTQKLAQQLEKVGKFSPEQVKFLPELLGILVKQHQEQLIAATIKDWLYEIQWKPLVDTQPKTSIQPGHWLIFADTTVVGENLAQQLRQQGCECSLVYRGDRYQKLEQDSYQINPAEPQEFEQLIQATQENSKLPLQRVVHLWSLDAPTPKDLTMTSLAQTQRWGCGTVLHLVKPLIKTKSVPKLWLVTRGTQSVLSKTEEVSVAASPLWGMGRVVSLEHPQLWGGLVDLDPQTPESETEKLLRLLVDNHQREDHLAFRGEHTYIARLVKQSPTASQPVSLKSNATYLITGGLGALGLHIAQWIVEQGAKNLVLTGRKQPSAKAQRTIEQLQKAGAQVLVLCGDISQEEDTTKILEEIKASLPTLRGVIHAAGLLDDALLRQMSWEQFTQVMAPKVRGAWHLHSLTQNLPLDFFVCFSSIASLLGSPGQGNYAAANAFMDALVHHRRGMGLPGLSINWGPWAEEGMAAELDSRHQSRMVAMGISPLASEQGLQVLGQLLGQCLPQAGVLPVEWSVFQQRISASNQMPLLSELVRETESRTTAKPTNTKQHELLKLLLRPLKAVSFREREKLLITYLQDEISQVLRISASQIDVQQPLNKMGLDSLIAVELRNRLQTDLAVNVSIVKFIEDISIVDLAAEVNEQLTQIDRVQTGESVNQEQSLLSDAKNIDRIEGEL